MKVLTVFDLKLVLGIALASMLAGCESLPIPTGGVGRESSVLGVEVRFPFPRSRDPSLIRVYLVRGPIHAGMQELPEPIPATIVKESRAYLLDAEPGTYSLVAVAFDYAPPRRTDPATGVALVAASGEDAGQLVVLPLDMIHRTRTTVGPGLVKFMGALDVQRGERISADTGVGDALQRRIAERIRPGVTSQEGIASRFSMSWTLDGEASTLEGDAAALDTFHRGASADFAASPWARVIPAPEPGGERARARRARRAALEAAAPPRPPAPPEAAVPPPTPAPAPSEDGAAVSVPAPSGEPPDPVVIPELIEGRLPREVIEEREREGIPADGEPDPGAIAALPPAPPGHALAIVEIGMSNEDVRAILGDPDARDSSLTARAWIPFYTGPDAQRITWIYTGRGRVVFSVDEGSLEVIDVVYEDEAAP